MWVLTEDTEEKLFFLEDVCSNMKIFVLVFSETTKKEKGKKFERIIQHTYGYL